jgi:hypothetical protein
MRLPVMAQFENLLAENGFIPVRSGSLELPQGFKRKMICIASEQDVATQPATSYF